MTDYTDLLEKLEFFGAGEGTRAEVCKRACAAIAALTAERDALRDYHEEIVHQFAGVSSHVATIISKAALGDERMKAIVEEMRKDRAALTSPPQKA